VTVRRTLLWVVALVASFAISASTALAAEEAGVGEPAPKASPAPATPPPEPTAPAEPAPAEPVPAEPAPTEPTPTEPATTEPGPTEPPAAEPASPNPSPTQPGPSDPAPTHPAPPASPRDATPPASTPPSAKATPSPRPETSAEADLRADPTHAGEADEGATALDEPEQPAETQEIVAVARNRNLVFQVVWQVQEGCRTHCSGTSQSQSAVQWSSTTQTAGALAGSGNANSAPAASGTAEAYNESVTVQFVWQLQIGCVAFCYETSQTQAASQWAQTIQTAIAEGDVEAWAKNLSETMQYVWQIQQGCEHECYGVIQSQTISQGQSTTQSAAATAGRDTPVTMLVLGPDGAIVLPGWLVALAENQGATIQTIYQYQEALCREYCEGDVQLQEAIQEALTTQDAIAVAWVGPPPAEDPPAESHPTAEPPAGEPPDMQPPADNPRAENPVAATAQTAPETRAAPTELPSRREIRRLRLLLSSGSDRTGASNGGDSRSAASPLPSAAGGTAPSGPAIMDEVPGVSSAIGTASRPRTVATTGPVAKRDELPSFRFGLALEPAGADESGGWEVVALLLAALGLLASVGLIVRRRLRPGI
jgi:hypothetical protein